METCLPNADQNGQTQHTFFYMQMTAASAPFIWMVLQEPSPLKMVSSQPKESTCFVRFHRNQSRQALLCLHRQTFAHKEADGSLAAVSSQQNIPDAPTASSPLGCLRTANSKFAGRAWESGTCTNAASSIITQALKLFCLSPEP